MQTNVRKKFRGLIWAASWHFLPEGNARSQKLRFVIRASYLPNGSQTCYCCGNTLGVSTIGVVFKSSLHDAKVGGLSSSRKMSVTWEDPELNGKLRFISSFPNQKSKISSAYICSRNR